MGIPTASEFKKVVTIKKDASEKKTRIEYLDLLAAEIISGMPSENDYTNPHMERGKEQEDEARANYAFIASVNPQKVGFVRNHAFGAGCSPDSLIGDDGGLEIKCCLRKIQMRRLREGTLPAEFKWQVQGSMWVTGRKWWDFVSYAPGLRPLIVHVPRDEATIQIIAAAVMQFNNELAEIVAAERRTNEKRDAA